QRRRSLGAIIDTIPAWTYISCALPSRPCPAAEGRPLMGLTRLLKNLSYTVAPSLAATVDEYWWLRKWVARLTAAAEQCRTPAEHFALLEASGGYQARQKTSEIVGLLTTLAELRP